MAQEFNTGLAVAARGKVLEIANTVAIIVLWISAVFFYFDLQERIPIQYHFTGEISNYGSKLVLIICPIVGTVLSLGIAFIARFFKDENPDAAQMLRFIKLALTINFLIPNHIVYFAAKKSISVADLSSWLIPSICFLSVGIFFPILYYVYRGFSRKTAAK